jgi:hypothetical protein
VIIRNNFSAIVLLQVKRCKNKKQLDKMADFFLPVLLINDSGQACV